MRADAVRNRERLLEAAIDALTHDPEASVASIARAAGMGRMTLYGHFSTREALIEAAFAKAMADGEEHLEKIDLSGDPSEALSRLIESSWLIVDRNRALLLAAQAELPPGQIREEHHRPRLRVTELIRRGQDEGVFRNDLSETWLAGVVHSIIHGATEEIAAGRLDPTDAARAIVATIAPALRKSSTD